MATLQVKYRLEGKALPPRPVKLAVSGWGGSPALKKENGSEPQPWHCGPFVEGCTHGVELLYQYETECHIINDNGKIRILWDRDKEPGGLTGPSDFTLSLPLPPQNYLFATSIDLQPPPGYVVRVEPHPRFLTDRTGTVPVAFYGHVQGEWWPKKLFMVFKVPEPGQRHIFRKGEPYCQVIFIVKDNFELQSMAPAEASRRRQLEEDVSTSKSLIGKNVWNSGSGVEFNDHYKVLAKAYERDGVAGVEALVRDAKARLDASVPPGKTIAQYLELAQQLHRQNRRIEAKEALHRVMKLDPRNAEAYNGISALEWDAGLHLAAVRALRRAVSLQPGNYQYHCNLGELLRRLGQFEEAQSELTAGLKLRPNHPDTLCALGFTMGRRGLFAEALDCASRAIELAPGTAGPQFLKGLLLSWQDRRDEARASFEAVLLIDPRFTPAQQALNELQGLEKTK